MNPIPAQEPATNAVTLPTTKDELFAQMDLARQHGYRAGIEAAALACSKQYKGAAGETAIHACIDAVRALLDEPPQKPTGD